MSVVGGAGMGGCAGEPNQDSDCEVWVRLRLRLRLRLTLTLRLRVGGLGIEGIKDRFQSSVTPNFPTRQREVQVNGNGPGSE